MREILFKGKHFVSRITIYGYYFVLNGVHYIGNDEGTYRVEPETVGQYTGLNDKTILGIFEGDIVRCNRFACDKEDMVGYIVYSDCGFCVKDHKSPNMPAMDLCDDFEVIGNLHDNPELLEVGGDGK